MSLQTTQYLNSLMTLCNKGHTHTHIFTQTHTEGKICRPSLWDPGYLLLSELSFTRPCHAEQSSLFKVSISSLRQSKLRSKIRPAIQFIMNVIKTLFQGFLVLSLEYGPQRTQKLLACSCESSAFVSLESYTTDEDRSRFFICQPLIFIFVNVFFWYWMFMDVKIHFRYTSKTQAQNVKNISHIHFICTFKAAMHKICRCIFISVLPV